MSSSPTDDGARKPGLGTLAIHAGQSPDPSTGARAVPIADALGAMIDGLYLREVLKSGPPDGAAAVATALAYLDAYRDGPAAPGADLLLTDVYLKGELSGHDLLRAVRADERDMMPVGDPQEEIIDGQATRHDYRGDLLEKDIVQQLLAERSGLVG